MTKYRLFSWGANSRGQLGQGNIPEEELLTPREIDLSLAGVNAASIKKIVGGAGHSLMLIDSGQVYSCGWNNKGQAGRVEQSSSSHFQRIDSLLGKKIIDVACGWDSSMAITEHGELFAWGSNSHGQLGLPAARLASTCTPTRVELEEDQSVKFAAMGLRHSALVTQDSKLLMCGANSKAQLGVDLGAARRCSKTFVPVPDLQSQIISSVACGQHHTMVRTRDNDIFTWGDNKHGQLGIDPEMHKTIIKPIKVDICKHLGTIHEIHCGWTHSAVSTSDKNIFLWGRNTYGQLGRGSTTGNAELWRAEAPVIFSKIQQVCIGSEHNIAIDDDQTVWSWGWNEHGNCGNGSNRDICEPTKVILPEGSAILIGAGAGHSFSLVKTN